MKFSQLFITLIFTSLIAVSPSISQTIGATLPDWEFGTLDIHHINTEKGEAAFFILSALIESMR